MLCCSEKIDFIVENILPGKSILDNFLFFICEQGSFTDLLDSMTFGLVVCGVLLPDWDYFLFFFSFLLLSC